MKNVTGRELIFYIDQKSVRECRLSEEIDYEYENAKDKEEEEITLEDSFIFDHEFDEIISQQKDRSGYVEVCRSKNAMTVDKKTQVNIQHEPEIRKVRNTTEDIKNTVATVSYRAGVSVPKARVAVQAVCEKLYGHKYLLQPNLPTIEEEDDEMCEPIIKKPRNQEEYKLYKNVLPSSKTINNYKHNKALQQEIDAAKALQDKDPETKVTLHYDTTRRSRVDGEWPALILNFISSDPEKNRMINLRPLFFCF